ncbi:TMV resistance protein N-like [Fagus crenata]
MDNDAVSFRLRWEVFLSFREEDTPHTFTSNLHSSLEKQGVRVFRHDNALRREDVITSSLLEAIEDSAVSIVIISPSYASSKWCLEELSKICECQRFILPVFYRVDPSDVRRQRGPFEEHFRNHEERFGKDKVTRWRKAMEKACEISGWVFTYSDEAQLVQALVKRVLIELSNTPVGVAAYTVGLDSRVEKLMKVLDVKSNGIQVLGLHGMGGVGKTTLAKALYSRLVGHFKYRSFISNVRETSAQDNGLVSLQKQLINDISPGSVTPIREVNAGTTAIKEIVNEKQVLVVLDDVDNISQINALIGNKEWFYEGSRIIITTRDRKVLSKHLVDEFHEVRELDSSESLQLFSYQALRREKPTGAFLDLSEQIVSLTGGLPLALEVFGSFLFDKRTPKEWEDALQNFKEIRPRHLRDVLKISFNGLDEQEQCIFLDIACLFVEMRIKREDAIDILKGCGFNAEIAVTVLTAKSLIKFTDNNILWMHDQVRDMGRQIVREKSLVDSGMRTRLWDRDEIMTVLKDMKGTPSIEGIVLDFEKRNFVKHPSGDKISWDNFRRTPNFTSAVTYLKERYKTYLEDRAEKEREVIICTKSFKTMVNLRLLQINNVNLDGGLKHLPVELKWLQWKGCPMKTLPFDFFPRKVAVLDLSESKIEQLWCSENNKVLENLIVLNLHGCFNLAVVPDLSGHQALEKLVLERCGRLIKIHESVSSLSSLHHLNLRDCSNLVELPSDVSGLKQLESLILSGCSKVKELPENIGHMKSLKELLLDETALATLPKSIFHLTNLEKLSLNGCKLLKGLPQFIGKLCSLKKISLNDSALEEIPDSIGSLENLKELSLMCCRSLTRIPDSIGNLKSLTNFFINGTAIKELPWSIGSLLNLKHLSIGENHFLGKLPDSIGALASIVELNIDGTSMTNLPHQIGALKVLKKLEMRKCESLKSLPELIGSMLTLTTLIIFQANISELPESIGMLENLIVLSLDKCKQLRKLPASIGKLKSLQRLLMEETAVIDLPESFGMLTSLMILKMARKPQVEPLENSTPKDAVICNTKEKPKFIELPTFFSNLSLLCEFDICGWQISSKIPEDFEKLSSLEILNLGHNHFYSLPSSLRGLSILKKLILPHCKELKSLPPLPSSLQEINFENCISLESMSDLSNLENLCDLNLTNCEKVVDIPGLECLKSLRRLYLSGCNACSSVVKTRLAKASLRNLHNISMPGSKIPDWFSQEEIRFKDFKNREIKGVIIGVIVSLNHQISKDFRFPHLAIVDIEANILKLDYRIFKTTLHLMGVPKTNDDQIYLWRYPNYHPLVSTLRDGYKIRVTKRNPPLMKEVELKKWGIYLVFDGDDDYEENSIPKRLARYFTTFEEDVCISTSGS